MILFGRSKNHLEVMAGDFLPFEKQLQMVIADADMNLQVLQFDPDSRFSVLYVLHQADDSFRSQIYGRHPSSQ